MISMQIKAIRNKAGQTQAEMGETLGVSLRTIASWESGERSPSHTNLIEIANKYNVSMDFIYGRTDTPKEITHEWTDPKGEPVILFNKTVDPPTDDEKRAIEQEHDYISINYEARTYDIKKIVDDRLREIFGTLINESLNDKNQEVSQ